MMRALAAVAAAVMLLWGLAAGAAEPVRLRIGLVTFGTVAWEIDTIKRHGLDARAGLDVTVVDLANTEAGKIALMGGSVDMIVSDWLWTSRQRNEGSAISFIPFSGSVGAVIVPPDSPITSVEGLRGRRIGVAGGPLDKNWLLLRALALRDHGFDPARESQPVFAAPPLLNQQVQAGQLDAVLTFWNFAARLDAAGYRRVVDINRIAARLGVTGATPALGYVFTEAWGRANPQAVSAFFAATAAAKDRLRTSDAAWEPLRPLMRAENEAVFAALRAGYREGIPTRWGTAERDAAAALFAIVAGLGGEGLTGRGGRLAPGTFWEGVSLPIGESRPSGESP